MKPFFPVLALLALAACHRGPATPVAQRAWVRLPAAAGLPAAGYFQLEGGRADATLVAAASALASKVELHESMAGGMGHMGGMRALDRLAIPAGARLDFAPGGKHLMLFGLDPAIRPGTAIPVRLGFADGTTAEIEAKTVAAGDPAPY